MLDHKGRLFGIVNIIDFTLIVIVIKLIMNIYYYG